MQNKNALCKIKINKNFFDCFYTGNKFKNSKVRA